MDIKNLNRRSKVKYSPEPIKEDGEIKWGVYVDEWDEGFLFESQGNALIFCLLLEIRDKLEEENS